MKELGEALKTIFDKISGFFDILDLSFLVSGATGAAALIFWGYKTGVQIPTEMPDWLRVLAFILGCYICGLVCFAVGRRVRLLFNNLFHRKYRDYKVVPKLIKAHSLSRHETIDKYLAQNENLRLYVRLWAEIRQNEQLAPSLSLLNRYWVLAATFDGMFSALLIWAAVAVAWANGLNGVQPLPGWTGYWVAASLIALAYVCLSEADRYFNNQAEELVATVAAHRGRVTGTNGIFN